MENTRPDVQRLESLVDMRTAIPATVLAAEVDLMPVKWPAYRFMSPKEATSLFTSKYQQAVKDYLKANQDVECADRVQPAKNLRTDVNNAHYTQMWKARQHADELGVPYEFYLRFCFDFYGRRKRKTTPRANQLRPTAKAEGAWMSEFKEKWVNGGANVVFYGSMDPMPQYFRENFSALPAQLAFHADLFDISKSSGNLAVFISKRVFELRQLTPEDCLEFFGKEIFQPAEEASVSDLSRGSFKILPYKPVERTELWQACFGIIAIDHAASSICSGCPQRESCQGMATLVTRQVKKKHGTDDPVRAKQLESGRKRTARCRAKKKGKFPSILELLKLRPPANPEQPERPKPIVK